MKVLRFTLIGLVAVVGLIALGLMVALTSPFQTWAAKKVLAKQSDVSGQIGLVDASFNHIRVEQLNLKRAGLSLALPSIDAELPIWAATQRDVHIKRLVAKGWTLDLTQPSSIASVALPPSQPARPFSLSAAGTAPDPVPAAVNAFRGLISQLKLPIDLSIDELELEGEIILPALEGQPPVRLKLTLTGGQLGVGREGRFKFNSVAVLTPATAVSLLAANGTLVAAMDTPRTFSRLSAEFDAEARGTQFPAGTRLAFSVNTSRANAGESYSLVADSSGRKLITLQASFAGNGASSTNPLAGNWTLDVATADLAPFALGRPLPQFVAKGAGMLSADATLTAFSAKGNLAGTIDQWDLLRPELSGVGSIKFNSEFDLVQTESTFRMTAFSADLSRAQPVLAVRALQPFEYNAATGELKVAEPSKDLISVDLRGVPLAWIKPWTRDFSLTGDDVRGSLVVGTKNGAFALRSNTPLTASNLSVTQASRPLFSAIDLSLKVGADYSLHGWQLEISDASTRAGSSSLATFAIKAGQLPGQGQPLKVTGQWKVNVGAATKQPIASHYTALIAGQASGDFVASVAAKQEYQARFNIEGLALDPAMVALTLPTIRADLRADIDEAGKITLNAPAFLENEGRKSDLTVAGTLTPRPAGWEVEARITSSYLATEDVQVLGASLAPALEKDHASPVEPVQRDAAPRWKGVSGRVTLALKKVIYQQKFEVSEVTGSLEIAEGGLKLEGLRAGLGEGSDVKLGGAVTFDAAAKNPYALKADFALVNFDAAPFFRALDPGKPATVEGRFNATSKLAGAGVNLQQLVEHTRGELQLTSRSGISRLLSADVSDKVKQTGSTVAAIGGLISAMTGQEKISDFANKGQIVTDIANALKEIPYDQLNVAVTRGEDLNFNLMDFTLISPEVRLTGTGEIHYGEGVPVLAQPLDLKLQLGTRGKLADLMTRASLVDGTQDNLGYAGFSSPLRIAGSLEKPDTSEIRNVLLKAAGGSLLKIW